MLTVAEARSLVLGYARAPSPRRVSLADALGLALAEPIASNLDLPPFDKALVDGYAVRAADCDGDGPHRLAIGEEIVAGSVATRALAPQEAASIMTGASLPNGADAAVMHERTRIEPGGELVILGRVRAGDGRLLRGREMRRGQTLFQPPVVLDAAKLGVLASVGKGEVLVNPPPRVAIVPTGDELVRIDEAPGPGQIRESNSVVLAGMVRRLGGEAVVHPVAPDEPKRLEAAIRSALSDQPDVLLLCGGVSAGKRDLVPASLSACGVETIFHKVRVKPGKPILFGVRADGGGDGPATLVFGLPGNPVGAIVGFLLLVAPALLPGFADRREDAELTEDFPHRGDRETYHPAALETGVDGTVRATPLKWAGSADLYTAARADGFVRFPVGDRDHRAGDRVAILRYP